MASDGATSPVLSAEGIALLLGSIPEVPSAVLAAGLWACAGIDVDGREGSGLPPVISVVPSAMLAAGLWDCAGTDVDGGEGSGLPPVISVVPSNVLAAGI